MIGKCYNCHKIRNTGLPSYFDPQWLSRSPVPNIEWQCKICYWSMLGASTNTAIEIVINRNYLMPIRHAIPFIAVIAVIIMVCLEIAVHTL